MCIFNSTQDIWHFYSLHLQHIDHGRDIIVDKDSMVVASYHAIVMIYSIVNYDCDFWSCDHYELIYYQF